MQIIIKTLFDTTRLFDILSNDLILSIKNKIFNYDGIPINEQYLIYNNTHLEDERTIHDYKIENNAVIYLILKQKN